MSADGTPATTTTPTDAPMTAGQLGLLAESVLSDKPALNVLQILLRFDGQPVDDAALRGAWSDLMARHDVLRLSFEPLAAKGARQCLHPAALLSIASLDWTAIPPSAQGDALDAWLEADRNRALDLSRAPAFRVALIRLSDTRAVMVWTVHHAQLDGGGYRILLRDLVALYRARRDDTPMPDAPQGPGFLDHCRAVARLDHQAALGFFRDHLSGFDSPNRLAPAFAAADPDADPQRRGHQALRLDQTLSDNLRARAVQAGATTANLIAAAWAVVLARCSERAEAVFGLTRSGRHLLADGAGIAGCQINTLPCRVGLRDQTLDGVLAALRAYTLAIHPHEHVPLSRLAQVTDLPGDVPLFETLVLFERGSLGQDMTQAGPAWSGLHAEERSQMASMLLLSVHDDPQMLLRMDHDPARISDVGATRLLSYLHNVLRQMAAAPPDLPIARIDMLPAEETARLMDLSRPRQPTTDRPTGDRPDGVIDRFEAMARAQPDAPALSQIGRPGSMSFATLDRRANHLAARLRAAGIGPGDIVGLALARSPEAVVGLLAILKAQAAFLPLDPSYPTATLEDMINRSGLAAILTDGAGLTSTQPWRVPVLAIGDTGKDPAPPPRGPHDPEARAYVIFTSGSTGRPKGVEVGQRALAHHAQAMIGHFALSPADRVLQFASLNFDVSIEEIVPTLLAGAEVVLRDDAVAASMPALIEALAARTVTVANLPTAFWHLLVAHLDDTGDRLPGSLRLMITGGERVSGAVLARWHRIHPHIRWMNGYGPTEATITSVLYAPDSGVSPPARVPIGRPTGHARAYVTCPDGSLAPHGLEGELWLGGPAVAQGYLDDPAQSARAFLSDPFLPPQTPPARVYRSGDRVSWGEDGTLRYHGRLDRQVKLRGFRIELSAIEAALEAHPAVASAVVLLDNAGQPDARLLAWVVPPHDAQADPEMLSRHLAMHLPAYMLPLIVAVARFPQTPGGKIDLAALPRPEAAAPIDPTHAHPADPDTARVQDVFATILNRDAVGPDQSFFDLGGHSLLSVQLMSMIEARWGQRLSLATLYRASTPRAIAAELSRQAGDGVLNALVPIQPLGARPPLYAVHILGPGGSYFQPMAALLGRDQPVIGLTLDLLDPSTPDRLHDIAAVYLSNIQRHSPTGPIQLIALSQGSYIAFELAQQLLAAGRDVVGLFLLDSEGPGGRPQRSPSRGAAQALQKLRRNFRHIVAARWHRLREELGFQAERARLSLARRRVLRRLVGKPKTIAAHQAAIDLAVAAYCPQRYGRPITLFVGRDNPNDTPEGIASGLGWNVVAAGGLRIIETGGLHLGVVKEPHLRELVAHLRPLLAPPPRGG